MAAQDSALFMGREHFGIVNGDLQVRRGGPETTNAAISLRELRGRKLACTDEDRKWGHRAAQEIWAGYWHIVAIENVFNSPGAHSRRP